MNLLRLCAEQVRPGEPLPWDVRNEPGDLLLNKGYVLQDEAQVQALIERGVFVDHEAFTAHQIAQPQAPTTKATQGTPTDLCTQLHQQMSTLLRSPVDNPRFRSDLHSASDNIRQTLQRDAEAAVFGLFASDPQTTATSHSVNTALVAAMTATQFGWSESEQATLTHAALTMNISALRLHDALSTQQTPLTALQTHELITHPAHSRALLEKAGVTNSDWLRTVEQHHVTVDGRGLPPTRGHLSEQACMIHYADVYMAKVSARAYRPAMSTQLAARELFIKGGGTDNPYVTTLIKEIGMYPPGSFVQLANGDVAVVMGRGEGAHTPQVHCVSNSQGKPYPEPTARNTAQTEYKVITGLPRGQVQAQLDLYKNKFRAAA